MYVYIYIHTYVYCIRIYVYITYNVIFRRDARHAAAAGGRVPRRRVSSLSSRCNTIRVNISVCVCVHIYIYIRITCNVIFRRDVRRAAAARGRAPRRDVVRGQYE